MSMESVLMWIEKLIAFAVLLQTIEMLQLRKTFSDQGIWSWHVLRLEFTSLPWFFRKFFDLTLSYRSFNWLLQLRLLTAIILLVAPEFYGLQAALIIFLLISTWLIAVRWRGSFNGGSDYMTFIVLLSLSVAALGSHSDHSEKWMRAGIWYIAIQTCLSLFIAGIVKFRNSAWREGRALEGFLHRTNYYVPPLARKWAQKKWLDLSAGRLIILFECTFPLALASKNWAIAYIAIALVFHLVNFYVFGLNRFFFAWAAAYPAVYFVAASR